MKTLCIICQGVDEKSDVLGSFIDWIKEFAKHYDHINIVAQYTGPYHLPSNITVYSLGKEKGLSKFRQFVRFYRLAWSLFSKANAIFVHMSPIYVVMAWPVAGLYRKRIVLWYLHRSVTLKLKLALTFCYRLVTASTESMQIKSPKIVETGHGINIARFAGERSWVPLDRKPLRVISVGRISPIKNLETLIAAAALLKHEQIPFHIDIIGRPIMPGDFPYEKTLRELVAHTGLSDVVVFSGQALYNDMPGRYKAADIAINLTPKGGVDKVMLEAMMAGCIPLTSNQAFAKYFDDYAPILLFKHGDAGDLAEKIKHIRTLGGQELAAISHAMKDAVAKYHSLEHTIGKITAVMNG